MHTLSIVCQQILDLVATRQPDMVVSLGDTLDTHERIYMPALVEATQFYLRIAELKPLVILIGNHDRQNNSDYLSDYHPFVALKGRPNITVVDKVVWDKDKKIIYVPYVPNGRFAEALSTVGYHPYDKEAPDLIFAHQEFNGCSYGSVLSTRGDPWSSDLPPIYSGHIHEYQTLPGVTYVGTFMQQNFGEGEDKAVMIIHRREDGIDAERIRLRYPTKVVVHLKPEEIKDYVSRVPSECEVKVVIHVDATETKALKQDPYYKMLKSKVAKVVERVQSTSVTLAQRIVDKASSLEQVVKGILHDDAYALALYEKEVLEAR